jgi:hypothetical protein
MGLTQLRHLPSALGLLEEATAKMFDAFSRAVFNKAKMLTPRIRTVFGHRKVSREESSMT